MVYVTVFLRQNAVYFNTYFGRKKHCMFYYTYFNEKNTVNFTTFLLQKFYQKFAPHRLYAGGVRHFFDFPPIESMGGKSFAPHRIYGGEIISPP